MNQLSGDNSIAECPLFQTENGGAIPTSPLQLFLRLVPARKAQECYAKWHYLGDRPCIAAYHYGVYFDDRLLGCISIGIPNAKHLLPFYTADTQKGWLEIKRFALSPACPKNSESRVIAVALKLIRRAEQLVGVVTYADSGVGHVGTIYKASGFEYVGLTAPKTDYKIGGAFVQRGKVAHLAEWGGQWVERSRKHLFIKRFQATEAAESSTTTKRDDRDSVA